MCGLDVSSLVARNFLLLPPALLVSSALPGLAADWEHGVDGLCRKAGLFFVFLDCSLIFAEARKGYVGGAPVVLGHVAVSYVFLVRWLGFPGDLV